VLNGSNFSIVEERLLLILKWKTATADKEYL
jgi:hypothetical protein